MKWGDLMSLSVVLILNAIILLAMASINNLWSKKSTTKVLAQQIIYGLSFGLMIVLMMNLAWGSSSGVFYDARTILISVVSAIYGWVTVIIMLVIGVVYRIILGGQGTFAGIVTIVCTAILGILFKRYVLPRIKRHHFMVYIAFGFIIHVFMLIYHFILPKDLEFILARIGLIAPTVLSLYPIVGAILFSIILTNDKNIESTEKLAESDERYRLLFNGIDVGIINFDKNGKIIECNAQFVKIMDSAKNSLIGLDMHKLPNMQFRKVLIEVLEGNKSYFNGEYQSYLSGKELYLEAEFTPIYKDGLLQGGVGIVHDITVKEKLRIEMNEFNNLDPLTGLNNRKAFEEDIASNRFGDFHPLEYCIVSIDNLQFYIDTLGYNESEKLITDFVGCLLKEYRNGKLLYRISLNDFAIINPLNSGIKMKEVLAKIRSNIRTLDYLPIDLHLTSATHVKEDSESSDWLEINNELRSRIRTERTYSKSRITKNAIDILLATLFEKSPRERQHSERVASLSKLLGKKINMTPDRIQRLTSAAILHDIGKVNIDLSILDKPGKLTSKEYSLIKKHTEVGSRILSSVPDYEDISNIVVAHHENYDGSGYPFNLVGDLIPIESRIISIVDSYDAMINDRPYRKAMSIDKTLKDLKKHSGTQFDPDLLESFIAIIKSNGGTK